MINGDCSKHEVTACRHILHVNIRTLPHLTKFVQYTYLQVTEAILICLAYNQNSG